MPSAYPEYLVKLFQRLQQDADRKQPFALRLGTIAQVIFVDRCQGLAKALVAVAAKHLMGEGSAEARRLPGGVRRPEFVDLALVLE